MRDATTDVILPKIAAYMERNHNSDASGIQMYLARRGIYATIGRIERLLDESDISGAVRVNGRLYLMDYVPMRDAARVFGGR